MNIIILIIKQTGRKKFFFIGADARKFILVFSNLPTALELCAKLEVKFACKLDFLHLQVHSQEHFENGVMKSAPPGHNYEFVYESTSEFRSVLKLVGI